MHGSYATVVAGILWCLFLIPHLALANGFQSTLSGYVKSLNFFSQTSGFVPEIVAAPGILAEEDENVFASLERVRLQPRFSYEFNDDHKLQVKIDYDHQAYFGSFVSTGDFRIAKRQTEQRQFLDLSQTLVEDDSAFYEHRLYRVSITYLGPHFDVEIGRQQIPWGVAHFFTPTDLFNPFNPTQIELDERDGVDAVNLSSHRWHGYRAQFVYTPPGKDLHPQRYLARVAKDISPYEIAVLGGRIGRDHAVGMDVTGTISDFAVRGEFLYREAEDRGDFVKFTVNADYNFPHNIYALLEYHFNGEGRTDDADYQRTRLIKGEIQQLGRNYLAASLGHDLTPLFRVESRTIFNMNDQSFFQRPEIQYEAREDFLITAGAQLFLGDNSDEYGQPKNLFLVEGKYSF